MHGGTGGSLPDQYGTGGHQPEVLITNTGRVGIGTRNPQQVLDVAGNILASGSISGATKSFDIPHVDPEKEGWRLRHWCVEGDAPGGSLIYKRQVLVAKAGTVSLTMPDWFKLLAKNVLVFVSPFRHFGNAWAAQSEADGNVIEVATSKAGAYNVLVTADRADKCATTMCPQEVEYFPTQEEGPPPFPPGGA